MVKVKIPKPYKIWIYGVVAMAWCSGVSFFVLETWFVIEGEFGIQKHPLQFPALQVHGFAAFLMMVTYGYFLGTHVQYAWKVKPRRIFGIILMILPAFLMITAYLLYYIAENTFREVVSYAHLGVGFSLPFILTFHVLTNYKKKKINRKKRRLHENKMEHI